MMSKPANKNQNKKNPQIKSPLWSSLKYIVVYGLGILSALVQPWFTNYLNEPELTGRVLIAISSRSGTTQNSEGEKKYNVEGLHTIFLTIGNKKKTPISIVDYQLILKFKDGEEDICAPYFVNTGIFQFEFDNYEITIRDNSQNLLMKKKLIVTSDNPVTGFVQFKVRRKIAVSDDIASICIILYDSYGDEYKIETNYEDLREPSILPRLIEGVEIKFLNIK